MENEIPLPIGCRFINMITEYKTLEAECEDVICTFLGFDAYGGDWPFDDFSWDDYDASFELKHCRLGWVPTDEQIQKCLKLGFSRCWLCYTDGTEKYYERK